MTNVELTVTTDEIPSDTYNIYVYKSGVSPTILVPNPAVVDYDGSQGGLGGEGEFFYYRVGN